MVIRGWLMSDTGNQDEFEKTIAKLNEVQEQKKYEFNKEQLKRKS